MPHDLIANSGLQFISIRLNLSEEYINGQQHNFSERLVEERQVGNIYELIHPYHWKDEDIFIDPDSINQDAYTIYGQLEPDNINRHFTTEISQDDIYKVRGQEALDICLGHWIPLPYFRIRKDTKDPFHHGPENWCRGMLEALDEEEDQFTHVLTLAFDTLTVEDPNDSEYFNLRNTDANDNGSERFKCVLKKTHAPNFFTSESLNEWMFNLYWLPNISRRRRNEKLRHLAAYHVILNLLDSVDGLPEIGLLSGENSIGVGLTLDIGNSRTCGLICEKNRPFDSAPFDFTSARKLRLRNLTQPHQVNEDPFEMQVAFAEEKFGNAAANGIHEVFKWPSLVRVGPEATALTSIFESADYQATLSSPKRYLWDKQAVNVPWIKVDRDGRLGYHENVDVRRFALYGIAEFITSDGTTITEQEKAHLFPATESRFSKASLMTFAIYEILLHTLSQINDPQFRRDMGNATYRRVLKDIVLTCPTAMTLQEQYQLRKAAMDAVVLLKRSYGQNIPLEHIEVHPKLPDLDPQQLEKNPWKMDEASCSQLSYIYGELVHKYASKKDLFFKIKGKERTTEEGETSHSSVNIASIDVGGGTTDLMICNYSNHSESDMPFVTPTPLFWEGFNIAGDDLVKKLIELILFPTIEKTLSEKDGKNVSITLNTLFGPNVGGQSAQERIFRKQFANQVAAPLAYTALEYVQRNANDSKTIQFDQIFERFPRPENGLLKHIDKTIHLQTGVESFCFEEVEFQLDSIQINLGVRSILKPVLDQLAYLVSQFDCDIILLSGRPSRIPAIKDILAETLLFSPDKIVCLGDYRFGQWYPFANANGYVNDPKSTVCVGSLIAYLNSIGRLPGMRFNLDSLDKIGSTANYIGILDANHEKIEKEKVLLSPTENKGKFSFYGEPVIIGMRQLASEQWISSPLYVFDFLDSENRDRVYNMSPAFPLTIEIQRHGEHGEFISKDNLIITDSSGEMIEPRHFEFLLRTSVKHQEHWRDSGTFVTRLD